MTKMAKKRKLEKKLPPSAASDETAKLIADAAIGIIKWVRATPARTAGALLVAGIIGAAVVAATSEPSK